jgi:hypothetical protein
LSPGCLQASELIASVASLPRLRMTQGRCSSKRTVNEVLRITPHKRAYRHLIPGLSAIRT